MLTKEQQAEMLHDAARLSGMDGHVNTDGGTAAEKIMRFFGGAKDTPRKMSYLYCDSVDACFYFSRGKACVTFTARWFAGAKDLEDERVLRAAGLIRVMLKNMQNLCDAREKGAKYEA